MFTLFFVFLLATTMISTCRITCIRSCVGVFSRAFPRFQVLKEAGVKLGGPEDGLGLDSLGGNGSGSDDGLKGMEV